MMPIFTAHCTLPLNLRVMCLTQYGPGPLFL